MANKIGKYRSFKDWLIWCRQHTKIKATSIASNLRRLEEDLLVKVDPNDAHLRFDSIHQVLKDYDESKLPNADLNEAIDQLKKINNILYNEMKASDKEQLSEVGYDSLIGWKSAFNSYLIFLTDATDCFTMDTARLISSRIGAGGIKRVGNVSEKNYKKRVLLFRCGVYKYILDKLGLNVTDNVLDAFSETVTLICENHGQNTVPTQFIVGNTFVDENYDWHCCILDNIRIADFCDYDYGQTEILLRCKFQFIRKTSVYTTAELLSRILYNALLFQNSVNRALGSNDADVISTKETQAKLETRQNIFNTDYISSLNIESLSDLLKAYAECFEIKFY